MLRSHIHLDLALSVSDFAHFDPSIFPRSPAHPEPPVPLFAGLRVELPLFVLDLSHPESSVLLRSLSCCGPALFAQDLAQIGSLFLPRSLTRIDFTILVSGLNCLGFVFPLFVTALGSMDFLISAHSPSCLDSLVFPLDFTTCQSFPSLQSSAYPGSVALISGLSCLGLVSFLSVVFKTHLGLPSFLHSFA